MAAESSEGKGEHQWYYQEDTRLHHLSQTGEGDESGITLTPINLFERAASAVLF